MKSIKIFLIILLFIYCINAHAERDYMPVLIVSGCIIVFQGMNIAYKNAGKSEPFDVSIFWPFIGTAIPTTMFGHKAGVYAALVSAGLWFLIFIPKNI